MTDTDTQAPDSQGQDNPGQRLKGWFTRLKTGLSRSANQISEGVTGIFTKRKLDDEALEELEELLIRSDLGVETAREVVAAVGKGRYEKEIAPAEIRTILADEIARRLEPMQQPFVPDGARRPMVVLVVGVNGTGKTTTIGKLAARFRDEGRKVMLAACDTFRAAAIEQLSIWGTRAGIPVVAREPGSDAAGLAYDALARARAEGAELLLIDTAGRLHNKAGLMAELDKIRRVLKKLDPDAPHATLLVLDATTGQNATAQVEAFREMSGVSGLVMTKLDGTARGGILVAIARRFALPVFWIGVGEKAEDLQPFDARAFARALVGADSEA
jgi:fused signal recognition particle receptor